MDPQELLPIYGDGDKYITKWLWHTPIDTIKRDLSDRQMKLKSRIPMLQRFLFVN
jgi:hypothetical protein